MSVDGNGKPAVDPVTSWSTIIRQNGWPTTLLVMIGLIGWHIAAWIEPKADKAIDTGIITYQKLGETQQKLTDHAEKQTEILDGLSDQQKQQSDLLKDIHRAVVKQPAVAGP